MGVIKSDSRWVGVVEGGDDVGWPVDWLPGLSR